MRSTFAFSLLLLTATDVLADLHTKAICVDRKGGQNVYNENTTKQSCTDYLNRQTGDEMWDTCPDCVFVPATSSQMAYCSSPAGHIGGDEITYYCEKAGSGNALTQ